MRKTKKEYRFVKSQPRAGKRVKFLVHVWFVNSDHREYSTNDFNSFDRAVGFAKKFIKHDRKVKIYMHETLITELDF